MNNIEATLLCQSAKYCSANLTWDVKRNHAGILIATSNLDDREGATIAGLTLQLEIKKAIVTERYQYELGLFQLIKSVRTRAYQLNVTPLDKKSHISINGNIYGPHEHYGHNEVIAIVDPILDGNFKKAFELYCSRINLIFTGNLNPPI